MTRREPYAEGLSGWLKKIGPANALRIAVQDGDVPLPDGRTVRYSELTRRDLDSIRMAATAIC